ncbi:hypothetical protein ANOM_000093 [Aspergillus nomiae NRRL 13137]|uniref:Uncharacterized protein n=1 Tax=Aspergillus nomiae NRRL (strain ATCC 15546 / NRRL 13137 / CBS 260.88 / M93) TaxID=1509407 RepID=A0A0L1JII0_ASPN3|nr:uncharacterized protein ANOM_000093 [Aspergillus nomiae NRRL 13137]KNG91556.1 hypothetical protein ANOM_000093 [Aspergillus nomiae NRRL 13137]
MPRQIAWDTSFKVHNRMNPSKSGIFMAWDFARVWDGLTMYVRDLDYVKWVTALIETCDFDPEIHFARYTVYCDGFEVTGNIFCEAHWHYAIGMNLERGLEFEIVPQDGQLETNHDGTLNDTTGREEFLAWVDDQYVSD